MCSLGWVIESNTRRSVTDVSLSFTEPDNRWERPSHRSSSSRWRDSPVPVLVGEVVILSMLTGRYHLSTRMWIPHTRSSSINLVIHVSRNPCGDQLSTGNPCGDQLSNRDRYVPVQTETTLLTIRISGYPGLLVVILDCHKS